MVYASQPRPTQKEYDENSQDDRTCPYLLSREKLMHLLAT